MRNAGTEWWLDALVNLERLLQSKTMARRPDRLSSNSRACQSVFVIVSGDCWAGGDRAIGSGSGGRGAARDWTESRFADAPRSRWADQTDPQIRENFAPGLLAQSGPVGELGSPAQTPAASGGTDVIAGFRKFHAPVLQAPNASSPSIWKASGESGANIR